MRLTLFVSFFVFTQSVLAAEKQTLWVSDNNSKIEIKIGYTFGTHKLNVSPPEWKIVQTSSKIESIKGNLKVPIVLIKEGDQKLECHLQSSLGLNYDASDFPETHVCDSNNKLPEAGSNAIQYPFIELNIEELKHIENNIYAVIGTWSIHGVTKPTDKVILQINLAEKTARLNGSTKIDIKNFGIIVKKAFGIGVEDIVSINFNLQFNIVTL
jgi:polyisoprenoid-binding protein YceI